MAISFECAFGRFGCPSPAAYERVKSYQVVKTAAPEGGDEVFVCSYQAEIFFNKDVRDAGGEPLEFAAGNFQVLDETQPMHALIYADIKAAPELAGKDVADC